MLCYQTTADRFVDLVINHPSVRPTIEQGTHRLSSLNVLSDHRNVCFAGEGGCALFVYAAPGIYEGHIMLLDTSRGAKGLAFGRGALQALSKLCNGPTVRAAVPLSLPAARQYVTRLGFVPKGRDSEQVFYEMETVQWAE